MNIASLLHRELLAHATRRADRIPAPTLTVREQVEAKKHDRKIHANERNRWPHSQFPRTYHSSCEDQAVSFYTRLAILEEYRLLIVEIDNALSHLFTLHREGKKLPALFRKNGFWKYYINLSRMVTHKDGKRDCARYAFLHCLDEADHKSVTGVSWKRDASDAAIAQIPANSLSRFLTKLDREHFELIESRNDYGSMSTAYEKKWTDGSSRLARSR